VSEDIHIDQPVLQYGVDPGEASAVVILVHGRGSSAQAMLPLAAAIDENETSFLIPAAAKQRWYPNSAFTPLKNNEPDLSSALAKIDQLIERVMRGSIAKDQIVIGGFSQGACLAATYMARNAARFGGLFVLSGALIGPEDASHEYPGSFNDMPVFIAGSDVDPWVAHTLISKTAEVFRSMQAEVDFRTYSGLAHTVNQDEIDAVRDLILGVKKTKAKRCWGSW
jgi:predicted esterase